MAPRRASPTSTFDSASTATGSRPGERLVEDEHVGLVEQRPDQLHPLLVAEGEVLQLVAGAIGQAELGEPAGRLLVGLLAAATRAAGRASAAARAPSSTGTGRAPPAGSRTCRRASWSIGRPCQRTSPASRASEPEDRPHGGRLAGPVGTEEPGHRSRLDGERHAVEGPHGAVGADQSVDFQHLTDATEQIRLGHGRTRRRQVSHRSAATSCAGGPRQPRRSGCGWPARATSPARR